MGEVGEERREGGEGNRHQGPLRTIPLGQWYSRHVGLGRHKIYTLWSIFTPISARIHSAEAMDCADNSLFQSKGVHGCCASGEQADLFYKGKHMKKNLRKGILFSVEERKITSPMCDKIFQAREPGRDSFYRGKSRLKRYGWTMGQSLSSVTCILQNMSIFLSGVRLS